MLLLLLHAVQYIVILWLNNNKRISDMAKQRRFEIRIGSELRMRLHKVAMDMEASDSEAARIAIRQFVNKKEG